MDKSTISATHWGNFRIETRCGRISAVRGTFADESPSPIGQSLLAAQDNNVRISQPMVREGFLRNRRKSDGNRRGIDRFVPVPWDTALDLAAEALAGIKAEHSNGAIFGGSYGWASAGRFHHAQSQTHRFLNLFGGYVSHRESYSTGAGEVILPYVMGLSATTAITESVQCEEMAKHAELLVAFGGVAMKNMQVNAGGVGNHSGERQLCALKAAGVRCVNVSPIKEDMADFLDSQWVPIRPTTDTALMLGLAYTLYVEDLYDKDFIARYTVGFDQFVPYLLGHADGLPKDASWAAGIADISANVIVSLAREMAKKRTLISASWSLQRAEHGEQSWWMALALASMLGYLGLAGAGINYGFGSVHDVGFRGRKPLNFKLANLPQGQNPIDSYIPVSRIADMLLNPGGVISYKSQRITYPDIKAVVWAGGNPFHHHQDLNKLVRAWAKPEAVIVNEIYWTSLARRADIVFPVTSPLERDDIAGSATDTWLTPSHKALEPYAEARNDYDIFSGLAQRLGFEAQFTENRNADEWIRHLYEDTVANAAQQGLELPTFDNFWRGESICLADQLQPKKYMLEHFREDPESNPLPLTPSGRIEIYSKAIANLGYEDCLGHPAWFEKREWLGAELAQHFPLHMISPQPKTRLHSQLDHGACSRQAKIKEREVMWIHARAAALRGIKDGDVVRLFNNRGACLAAAKVTENMRPDIVILPTGAWYDPVDPNSPGSLDSHGNPNVLTQDIGSSQLGQACAAQSCLINVELYQGVLPPIKIFSQPGTVLDAAIE